MVYHNVTSSKAKVYPFPICIPEASGGDAVPDFEAIP